jgi:hypothetical protein
LLTEANPSACAATALNAKTGATQISVRKNNIVNTPLQIPKCFHPLKPRWFGRRRRGTRTLTKVKTGSFDFFPSIAKIKNSNYARQIPPGLTMSPIGLQQTSASMPATQQN